MKAALVIQRHELSRQFLQELLHELDYESTPTDNLEDAVRLLQQKRFDVVITGNIYQIAPDGPVGTDLWVPLHKKVNEHSPQTTFILYTSEPLSVLETSPFGSREPEVHYVHKFTNPEESFRQLLE